MFFARLSQPIGWSLSPFFEVGSAQIGINSAPSDLYFAPGMFLEFPFGRILGQHRFHTEVGTSEKVGEWRLLLVSGFRKVLDFPQQMAWQVFVEPYTEILHSSRSETIHFWNSLLRAGFQYPISLKAQLELFLEPRLSISESNQLFYFAGQLSPTLGFRTCMDPVCVSFSVAQILYFEENRENEVSFLASLGGTL